MSVALRCALVLLWVVSAPFPSLAQAASEPTAASTADAEGGTAVLLDGEVVLHLHGGSAGGFSLEDRVRIAEEKVRRIAEDPFYAASLLTISREEDGVSILYRGERFAAIPDVWAAEIGVDPERRAREITDAVETAVARYRDRRRPEAWEHAALLLALATGVLIATLLGLSASRRRAAKWVEARRHGLSVGGQRLGFRSAARLTAFQLRALGLVHALAAILVVLIFLQTAFAIVPITRGYAFAVLRYLVEPLEVVGHSLLANVGNLFFIAVVVIVARLLLRGVRALLAEAAFGTIHLPGVPQDRAMPLYKIVRLVVLAITMVMIYPYIPGSSSAAFQGISLFAGALFTLGASSTASNFIGGMVLVFSGAFQIGDRVEIDGVVGSPSARLIS
jgi:hypothetical protein